MLYLRNQHNVKYKEIISNQKQIRSQISHRNGPRLQFSEVEQNKNFQMKGKLATSFLILSHYMWGIGSQEAKGPNYRLVSERVSAASIAYSFLYSFLHEKVKITFMNVYWIHLIVWLLHRFYYFPNLIYI